MTRFNEAIDQALAESIASYSDEVARSRDMFLAILSHDLRNPLSAIANSGLYLGTPGVLPRGAPLTAARRINSSVAKMSLLIKDLLEYTRTRLGRSIPITREATSIEKICSLALEEMRAAHPERRFELEVSGELFGQFDGGRLQQMLSNLLGNAAQNGVEGQPITLSAHGEPDGIIVRVKNHGRAISACHLQVIFDPLVQLPSTGADRTPENLGLGLYIAREIVTMHGGTLVAESSVEDGTVFSARLPRNPGAALRA
jgi:signal transduction histidine kinase